MLKFRPLRWIRYHRTKRDQKRRQFSRDFYKSLVRTYEIAAKGGVQSVRWISKDKGLS